MRQEPWYLPCAPTAGVGCREFAASVDVSICWLYRGIDEARALVLVLSSSNVSPVSSPLLSPLLHASLLINVVFYS